VADTHEPFRQDVQQETPQKFVERKGHELLLVLVRGVAPAEGDSPIAEGNQAMVGDGYAMGVAA
jgi:hypothetical protein